MFRNTKEPSSGSEHLCLAKVTRGSMVPVHVNSVSIVAAYTTCNGKSVCLVLRHICQEQKYVYVFRFIS